MDVRSPTPRHRWSLIGLLFVLATVVAMDRPPRGVAPIDERIRLALTSGMDSLAIALDGVERVAKAASTDPHRQTEVTLALRRARLAYKSVEGLLEYFDGMTASILNGRDTDGDGDEDDAPASTPPEPIMGFAALELSLAKDAGSANLSETGRHAMLMARTVRSARSLVKHLTPEERQLFDAARAELVRITTLGLGGFDAAAQIERLPEAVAALRGLRQAMASCLTGATGAALQARRVTDARFAAAIARFEAGSADDVDAFTFISEYLYPLARAVNAERRVRGAKLPVSAGGWRATSDFIFDRDAFDPTVYAPSHEADTGVVLAALGEALFSDPALSGDGTRTCAFCHQPNRAFTDGRPRAETIDSLGQSTARNTPTLINGGFQPAQFADLRVRSLEDQIATVVASPTEMRGNLDSAAAHLSRDVERRRQFARAFQTTTITGSQIQAALAAYLRSLTAVESRFDRAIRGDKAAMTTNERRGFNVFMGKARCGSCHFAPFFNGTMPPDYWATPPEVIGVPAAAGGATVDPDLGRAGIDGLAANRFAFKTPTLRNIAVTAPYMHNGVFRTLDEVLDFYDKGGGAGFGINLPNQTLRPHKLELTTDQRRDLIAFLGSLTDTVVTRRARVAR